MKELFDIFDTLLTTMVSYPVTLFHLFFSPEKVGGDVKSPLICPPGVSLIVSLTILYFAESTRRSILCPSADWPRFPPKALIIRLIVTTNIILLLQYVIVSIPFLVPGPPTDPRITVGLLSYPVSVSMVVYGLAYLFFILFPFSGKLTILERLDSIWRDIRKDAMRIVPEENAGFMASLLSVLGYVFCLYNIIRSVFQLSFRYAIFLTSMLAVITLLSLIGVFTLFQRYERRMQYLFPKRVPGRKKE